MNSLSCEVHMASKHKISDGPSRSGEPSTTVCSSNNRSIFILSKHLAMETFTIKDHRRQNLHRYQPSQTKVTSSNWSQHHHHISAFEHQTMCSTKAVKENSVTVNLNKGECKVRKTVIGYKSTACDLPQTSAVFKQYHI